VLTGNIAVIGSSPRAWGTLDFTIQRVDKTGFIPTRVGNTFYEKRQQHDQAVHPHARGEHVSPAA